MESFVLSAQKSRGKKHDYHRQQKQQQQNQSTNFNDNFDETDILTNKV